jgi:hypothetical protein
MPAAPPELLPLSAPGPDNMTPLLPLLRTQNDFSTLYSFSLHLFKDEKDELLERPGCFWSFWTGGKS